MRPPRRRQLSAEERSLWAEIAKLIKPLRRAGPPAAGAGPVAAPAVRPVDTAAKAPPPAPISRPARPVPPAAPKPAPPPVAVMPPLAPLERRVRTGLRRGSRRVDAVIDLHGMRQAEAHAALAGFLNRSRGAGHTIVLVVTGKGGAGGDPERERGVLRRSVPHWLRLPEMRNLVLGFEEASLHHGGSGALYVRLRRR
ncbi:MAG: Smr/MutS family protein [Methylobacterium frigidaeris]